MDMRSLLRFLFLPLAALRCSAGDDCVDPPHITEVSAEFGVDFSVDGVDFSVDV